MIERTLAPDHPDSGDGFGGYSPIGTSNPSLGPVGWASSPEHPPANEENLGFSDEPEDVIPPLWLPARTAPIASEPELIRRSVLDWRIAALGGQPRHHMSRDLLHAGLLGDPRTVKYHDLTRNPPHWITDRVAHLEPRFRIPAIQHTALDFLHRSHLGRLWANARNNHGPLDRDFLFNGREYGLLLSLAACRPVGALLAWRGAEPRTFDYTCGYARVCPWCHARKVLDLHDRLAAGPCRPERMKDKAYVRIGLYIQGDDLRSNAAFADFARKRGHDVVREGSRWRIVGTPHMRSYVDADGVKLVRDFLAAMVGQFVARFGITGGIVTFQVGPQLSRDEVDWDPFDYRYALDVVGEQDRPDRRKDLWDTLGFATGEFPMLCSENGHASGLRGELVSGTESNALRLLLAGPSYHPLAAKKMRVNKTAPRYLGGRGGVLRWPPWFLADPVQWWPHHDATRRLRLYSAFGTWKEELARVRADVQEAQPANLADRSRRNQAQALHRRQGLLKAARAVGKGQGHKKLRAALAGAGHDVSERDARWLARRLG